jgi:hypothetical protein
LEEEKFWHAVCSDFFQRFPGLSRIYF